MSEQDILSIDTSIQKNFVLEASKLSEYKEKLEAIERSLQIENIRPHVRITLEKCKVELQEKINDIETSYTFNFYIIETTSLLDKYRSILEAPMKMSFIGKPVRNSREKEKVVNAYIEIARKYTNVIIDTPEKKNKIVCGNCPNRKDFDIDGNIYMCIHCSAQQVVLKHISSYKDIDRVNISSRYMYDRKIHFRDCINQYQGKQNSTILQKVYDDLEKQFDLHHLLLLGDKDTSKEIRFRNITKEHIGMFLKELEYTKHYENINLIHYNLTGVKPDNISHLEDKLLDDFDALTELYDKRFKDIDRKNFINTQYVLYQLLSRHKHSCNKEDFTILKTIDRKSFHDDICRVLFEEKGWNHNPYF